MAILQKQRRLNPGKKIFRLMSSTMRDEANFENEIRDLLANSEFAAHPLRWALEELLARYSNQLGQLEKLTSISDGYQLALRDTNQTLSSRYHKQIRQVQKIIRISDHYQKMLQEMNEQLKVASTQDPLTALPNRRLMQDRLKSESAKSLRHRELFSLALIDVDHFKIINDSWGHDVGDSALICLAHELSRQLRVYDICARWGGEEFLVLLPSTSGTEAVEIAHRLRVHTDAICSSELPPGIRLSVSIGVAEHNPDDIWETTLKRADGALYQAKNQGRNRVFLSEAV